MSEGCRRRFRPGRNTTPPSISLERCVHGHAQSGRDPLVCIGRRTMRIARQSILTGLGLSAVTMVAAALGYAPPMVGAALQETIDVAVIVNALRASR